MDLGHIEWKEQLFYLLWLRANGIYVVLTLVVVEKVKGIFPHMV